MTRPIDSYGWMDGKKLVKVLIDFENAISIEDEMIHLVSFSPVLSVLFALFCFCYLTVCCLTVYCV